MDSSGLTFSSLEELQSHCSLTRELTTKYERQPVQSVYKSIEFLINQAKNARGDLEKQYECYMKAGELSDILRQHTGFDQFKAKKENELNFYAVYTKIVDNLQGLQALLSKKYDGQKLRKDKIERASSIDNKQPSFIEPKTATIHRDILKISPRELIRMVEKDAIKKSAIIFDYRMNKTESIFYRNENLITIIQIPNENVENSMIFEKMRKSLDVKQRTLLARLPEYDFAVLMEDDTPALENGVPMKQTKAYYIWRALTEYIGQDFKTKNKPMFMDGGFKMWKAQYPTYTTTETTTKSATNVNDELADTVKRLRREYSLAAISYADLSAPKPAEVKKPSISPTPTKNEIRTIKDSTNVPATGPTPVSQVPPTTGNENTARAGFGAIFGGPRSILPQPERPGPPIFSPAPGIPLRPAPVPTLPNMPPNAISPHPVVPDRSVKPMTLGPRNEQKRPEINNSASNVIAEQKNNTNARLPPTLDRSSKPPLITPQHENALLSIYDQMTMTVSRSGTSRNGNTPGITGLFNMGNTCFMSANLQCLFHTPFLSDVFTRENFLSKVNPYNKMGTKGVISAAFSALMDLVWSGQFQAFKPQRFLQLFADEVNSSLADGQQHDASEFQLFLLDALHEDTNQVLNRVSFEQNYKGGERIANDAKDFTTKNQQFSYSPVQKIFSVLTVSELTCCSCSESSATFEDNTLISVELSSMSSSGSYVLDDCLKSHFSQTKLDGDSRWNCPKCKTAQPAVRRTKLWSLPPVLVIHLKRFSLVNGEYVKNTAPVHFETTRFDPSSCLHSRAPKDQKTAYRLYGVTNHSGRLNSGHYTAIASHLRLNKWFRFDDESVTASDISAIDNRAAYILFYKKV